jgi:TolB-like protein/Tfp pilus assembly protein PilF
MQVLVALARRRGEVVSRDDLIRDCWNTRVVGDDAINRCIARVRRLSEAEGGFTLETIPRVGYRLMETAAPVGPQGDAATPAPPRYLNAGVLAASLALLVVLAAGGVSIWRLWHSPTFVMVAPRFERVAVLPLEALSSQEDVRFFGDAVSEQMIGVLNDNQVQTVSRADSAALRGPGRDEAAGKLGAEFILDGTVQRGDAGLRVTVHLDHALTHATVWTESFDQAGEDLLAFQAQVAAKAVDKIKVALDARKPDAGDIDDGALAAYLKAQEILRQYDPAQNMQAHDLYVKLVARAPKFSPGYSGLAITTVQLQLSARQEEVPGLQSSAREAAKRALELDPANGEAYMALALLVPLRHWAEQEALYRQGLAAKPAGSTESSLCTFLGYLMQQTGRLGEAVQLKRRALMLDPLSGAKTAGLAQMLADVGRLTEANAIIDRAARLWPTNPREWLTRLEILGNGGREADARAMLDAPERAPLTIEPDFVASWRAYLEAVISKTPDAKALAKRTVLAARASGQLNEFTAIEMLARLGETDAAYSQANLTFARPIGAYKTYLLFRPTTASMRADERFRDLTERLGLFAYWKSTRRAPDFCATEMAPVCQALAQP